MALPVVEYLTGFPVLNPGGPFYDSLYDGEFQTPTSTRLVLEAENGARVEFRGEFDLSGGMITGGTVESFHVFAGRTKVMKETGLDLSATALIDGVAEWQMFNYEPIEDLLIEVTAKHIGSEKGDFIQTFGEGSRASGREGSDQLIAYDVETTLMGGKGNDLLFAGEGFSWYSGGKGADTFVFVSPDTPNKIKDFGRGDDLIQLNVFNFTAIEQGFLAKSEFKIGGKASAEDQFIIYQKGKGNIWYDQDGSGTDYAAVKFAKVKAGTDLSHRDFYGDYDGGMLQL
jgi:Ca2+-binding RTX toxin-like protein